MRGAYKHQQLLGLPFLPTHQLYPTTPRWRNTLSIYVKLQDCSWCELKALMTRSQAIVVIVFGREVGQARQRNAMKHNCSALGGILPMLHDD